MRIFGNGQNAYDWALLIGGHCRMAIRAFVELPTVILTALRRRWLVVDLLPMVLADIRDEEVAGLLVEMEHVGIAKAVGPDLWPRADLVGREALFSDSKQRHQLRPISLGERVVLWNSI